MVVTTTAKDFPYRFLLPKMQNQWAASDWCRQQFGEQWNVLDNRQGIWCWFWRGRDNPGSYEWYFQNEQDAIMFLLKWS